jgi:hypothetical protein
LRWHSFENRFQSCRESRAGIERITFVIPSEVENVAVRETATQTGRPKAERTGSEVNQIFE